MREAAISLGGIDLTGENYVSVMEEGKPSTHGKEILMPDELAFEVETGDSGRGVHKDNELAVGHRGRACAVAEAAGET